MITVMFGAFTVTFRADSEAGQAVARAVLEAMSAADGATRSGA
jgi:hypothetical protein